MSIAPDIVSVKQALALICEPGSVYELRSPKTKRGVVSGYFNDLNKLAMAAISLSGKVPAVYITLNPVNPDLLSRADNHLKEYADTLTSDNDIIKRNLLLIDLDPDRPAGISSTDAEKELARVRQSQVVDWLVVCGISLDSIILGDSGNGYHSLVRIDLSATPESTLLCQRVLEAIAAKFSDKLHSGGVLIDTTVYNAARISKIYGTLACKGDSTANRPHRMSKLLTAPDKIIPVTIDQLTAIVNTLPPKQSSPPRSGGYGQPLDIDNWIATHSIGVERVKTTPEYKLWELKECPWNPDHNHGEAWIQQFTNGAIAAGCHHNSCAGKSWADLRSIYEPKQAGGYNRRHTEPQQATDTTEAGTALPEIIVSNRQLRDITADALGALYAANKPEFIFWRSGALTRISLDEKGRPFTETLTEAALRGYLARCCNFVKITTKDERVVSVAVPPPIDVVRDIASLGNWQFPPLLGITESPVVREDGTLLIEPGYDARTNLFFLPAPGLKVPLIPNNPTAEDIKEAVALALEPLADFPFDSEASFANAVATMITPIVRPMIDSPTPLSIIDKPQAGTGATLFAQLPSLLATGRAAAVMTAQRDDEGWRKSITSLLVRGQQVVTIDNLEAQLFSPSLAAVLTATTWQDRILGRTEMVTLPNLTSWIATGNNTQVAGDLNRRCIWSRLNAQTARPWLRDTNNFQHPHLIEWVSQNRGAILAAILTIARAWVVSGKPEAKGLPTLGGFESYCSVVGGVLAFMGVKGFLGNLSAMYDSADTDTPQWEAFLETWLEIIGNKAITAAELVSHINDNPELRAALPDVIADTSEKNYTRRLGNTLTKRKDIRLPCGVMLKTVGAKKRALLWQVVDNKNDNSPSFSFKVSYGEFTTTQYTRKKGNIDNAYSVGGDEDSPNSPLGTKQGELAHQTAKNTAELPAYPSHPCPRCEKENTWAVSPSGSHFICHCGYQHREDCGICFKNLEKGGLK